MKGQKLFVRPLEAADYDALRNFLDTHSPASPVPACGLLGKLVGDVVAVLGMQIMTDELRIDELVVARDLRRKHIGRLMIAEAAQIAARMELKQLVVSGWPGADGFLRNVGFTREGDEWLRTVISQEPPPR